MARPNSGRFGSMWGRINAVPALPGRQRSQTWKPRFECILRLTDSERLESVGPAARNLLTQRPILAPGSCAAPAQAVEPAIRTPAVPAACPSAGPQVCRLCPKGRCPPRCRRTHRPLSSESTVPTPRARCGSGAASRLLRLYLSARGARQVTAPRRPLLPS